MNCDAAHPTAPDPGGIAAAIRLAHEQAGVTAGGHRPGPGARHRHHPQRRGRGGRAGRGLRPGRRPAAADRGEVDDRPHLRRLRPARRRRRGRGRWPPGGSRRRSACASRWPRRRRSGSSGTAGRTADLRLAQVDAFGFGGVNAVAVLERAGGEGAVTAADPVVVTGVGLALPGVADAAARCRARTRAAVRAADPVEPADRLGRRGLRYLDRASQLALCAGRDALRDAGLLRGRDRGAAARRTRSAWWSAPTSATSTPSARSPRPSPSGAPTGSARWRCRTRRATSSPRCWRPASACADPT